MDITENTIEVQHGLRGHFRGVIVGGKVLHKCDLYSADGYCFYMLNNSYNEDGELLDEFERVYYRKAFTPYASISEVNAAVVSVPIKDGYEIAN